MSCAVHSSAQAEIAVALHGGDVAEKHRRPEPVRLEKDKLPQSEALAPAAQARGVEWIPVSQIRTGNILFLF
jgi:hypothetical protein